MAAVVSIVSIPHIASAQDCYTATDGTYVCPAPSGTENAEMFVYPDSTLTMPGADAGTVTPVPGGVSIDFDNADVSTTGNLDNTSIIETGEYLGRQYRLKVVPHVQAAVKLTRGFIVVQTRRPNSTEVTRELVDAWYRERAYVKFA